MSIVLFDNASRSSLLPLSSTKAVAELRYGILTMKERWEKLSGQTIFIHSEKYLQPLYTAVPHGEHTWIDASVVLNEELVKRILSLETDECIADEQGLIAGRKSIDATVFNANNSLTLFHNINNHTQVQRVQYPWQFMQWNESMIKFDFALVTKGRKSEPIPATVQFVQAENIFIEEGAKLSFCIINASTGPVYIGKNAEIMEGSVIRGPLVLCDNAVLKLNSRVYGATTLGPSCMGGGEIKNTVMMGFSNKAHDGYLGDSVVGSWCNFGAGSTNSNLKNTAGTVKVWDMASGQYLPAGQKCGVIMGDYSRVAINASINTGSVIGVSSNVFGAGLLPTIVDHFSWGVSGTKYELPKALMAIDNWKKLKGYSLSPEETSVLTYIFEENNQREKV